VPLVEAHTTYVVKLIFNPLIKSNICFYAGVGSVAFKSVPRNQTQVPVEN